MKWINDWPMIGIDKDEDGKGEPVIEYKKPNVGKTLPIETPAESDEFNSIQPGLQWQWHANPKPFWSFINNGNLRLYAIPLPDSIKNLWSIPNLFLQKFPAEKFTVTVKLNFKPISENENSRNFLFTKL